VVAARRRYNLMCLENTSKHTKMYRTPPPPTGSWPLKSRAHRSPGFWGRWFLLSISYDVFECLTRQTSQQDKSTTKDNSPFDNYGRDHCSKWRGWRICLAEAPTDRTVIWLRQKTPILYIDNASAIKLTMNPKYHKRSKHIEVQHFYVRERYLDDDIGIEHIDGRKTSDRHAYKTHWPCSILNTVTWHWNHFWGTMKRSVQCLSYYSVLEKW